MCTILIEGLTPLNRTSCIKMYKNNARSRLFCRIAKRSIGKAAAMKDNYGVSPVGGLRNKLLDHDLTFFIEEKSMMPRFCGDKFTRSMITDFHCFYLKI